MIDKLLYKELSYKIRGILFEVHNELGQFRNEKQYGDAFEDRLKQAGIQFEREKVLPTSFSGEKPGRNRIDFIINKEIVVELKHVPAISRDDYMQCQRYLSSLKLELALLVNFRTRYLTIKRVLNHEIHKQTPLSNP